LNKPYEPPARAESPAGAAPRSCDCWMFLQLFRRERLLHHETAPLFSAGVSPSSNSAFVLPLLLLLTFGSSNSVLRLQQADSSRRAARRGRVGIIALSPGTRVGNRFDHVHCGLLLRESSGDVRNASNPVTTVTGTLRMRISARYLSVKVDYEYSFIFSRFLTDQSKISSVEAVAVMRYE